MRLFSTSRQIPATPEQIFSAFSDPVRMAKWWGPAGFTNTFHVFEFREGGNWHYTMHGPKAGNYRNQSIFEEIEFAERVEISHLSEPKYRLVIKFTPSAGGTLISWEQTFEKEHVAERVKNIVIPANEENLDRLSEEVLKPSE